MKPIDLLTAIGNVDEDLLLRSESSSSGSFRLKPLLIAACLLLIVPVYAYFFLMSGMGGMGSSGAHSGGASLTAGDETEYAAYFPPVLPMTLNEPDDAITAQRALSYHFSQQGESAAVTDSYTISNSASEAKTVTLSYPVYGSLSTFRQEDAPTITQDGAPVEYTLHPGPAVEEQMLLGGIVPKDGLSHNLSYHAYEAMLSDGSYRETAVSDRELLTLDPATPVVGYHFSDLKLHNPEADDESSVDLAVSASGWTVSKDVHGGFPGWSIADQDAVFYSIGGPLSSLEVQAYSYSDGFHEADVTTSTWDTDIDGLLAESLGRMNVLGGIVTEQLYVHTMKNDMEQLYQNYGDYFFNGLSNVISIAGYSNRILYMTFDLTIPAGESRTVSVNQQVSGSYNIDFSTDTADQETGYAYEVMTTLDSCLTFTEETAAIESLGELKLLRQNYGFDPEKGILRVSLDLSQPYYYLSVGK